MAKLMFETSVRVSVDGVDLVADLIRPSTGRHPAVVVRTPYDRKTAASTALQVGALRLAEAGYAVVIQDTRGRGESGGTFEPFVNEATDGIATIEWVADQRWCTGAVGLAGVSYPAYCQTAVAAAGLEQLRAWVPALAPLDVRNGWIREGGALQMGFHRAWVEQGVLDQSTLRHWQAELDPYPDDARVVSAGGLDGVRAPALVVAGWYDLFQPSTFDLYRELASSGVGHALVAGPWGHTGLPLSRRTGDRDQGPDAVRDLHSMQRAWFDHHLLGVGDGLPAVEVFITGQRSWERFERWPPKRSSQHWYPAAGRFLNPVPGAASTESVEVDPSDPTPCLGGRVFPWEPLLRPGAFDQRPVLDRDDVLWYASETFEEDVVVAGEVRMSAEVDGETSPVDLYVVLCEIDPDGAVWNLADGIRRSSRGRIEVVMGSLAHRFRSGTRLGLLVAFAAHPRFDLSFERVNRRVLGLGPGTFVELPVIR